MNSPLEHPAAALAVVLAVATSACAAPFSDLQSARTLAPGITEITGSYSYVQGSAEGDREKLQDNFGLQVAHGLTDRTELRAKYFYISPTGFDGDGVSVLGLGPKVSLQEDRVAVYSPIGVGFGGGIESGDTWQWQPTLLATFPLGDQVELNTSGKAQVWLTGDGDTNLGFNLGLGVGPDLDRWAIRPEVGVLINPGEDGSVWSFSLGMSTSLGR